MILCEAIAARQIIQFNYSHGTDIGSRIVEPYQVGDNVAGHEVLSAWFLSGASESGAGPGWREYLTADISNITAQGGTFPGNREEYKEGINGLVESVECEI